MTNETKTNENSKFFYLCLWNDKYLAENQKKGISDLVMDYTFKIKDNQLIQDNFSTLEVY